MKTYRHRVACLLALAFLLVTSARADSRATASAEHFLAALRRAHPGTAFDAVRPTPVQGLYEIRMGQNVAYASADNTRYLVFGHLFDTRSMRDLTPSAPGAAAATRDEKPGPVKVAELPLADAIREVKGSGRRQLFVFADARCAYCRQLDAELAKVDDVTIYTFPVPMIDHDAPVGIWCSVDRAAAWHAVMRGAEPPSPGRCSHPVDRNAGLMQRLGIRGTPTLLFADGTRLESAVGADVIEARLAAAYRSSHHD